MALNYRARIEESIGQIRRISQIDVSGAVGRVLHGFVSYYKEHESDMLPAKFFNLVDGLHGYLTHMIERGFDLEDIRRTGGEICGIIGERNPEKIAELEGYLHELAVRKTEQITPLSLRIPESWLNRKAYVEE